MNIQKNIKDAFLTGLISLALFGPIVGLKTVAENEKLVIEQHWDTVFFLVVLTIVGRIVINIYREKKSDGSEDYYVVNDIKSSLQ